MRYWKLETNPEFIKCDPHLFRDDGMYEAIDNLSDEFFPIKISIATKQEYMDETYGEDNWSQEDRDSED